MENRRIPTAFEFLKNEVYLPGYMTLISADYDLKGGKFEFNIREPKVTRGSFVNYFTPRGLHICVSQAGYALVENMINEGVFEELNIQALRQIFLQGRVKIIDLYQKFRKEIELSKLIEGRFNITRLRLGKMPVLQLDFDFGNRAVSGNLTSLIVQKPMLQINQDLLRFKI